MRLLKKCRYLGLPRFPFAPHASRTALLVAVTPLKTLKDCDTDDPPGWQ